MYTVHTTAPKSFAKEAGLKGINSGDCFYGWGEERLDMAICPKHVTFDAPSLEAADSLASLLVLAGHQVVVTSAADWSVVITGSSTPIFYKAEHQH